MRLRTLRMELIRTDSAMLRADARDRPALSRLLDAAIPAEWPPELFAGHQEFCADKLDSGEWSAMAAPWYWVNDEVGSHRTLIGSGGVGPMSEESDLMCGYSIIPSFHGRGLATEAMRSLLMWAFAQPGVERVIADTFPHLKPSIRVMEKLGMTPIGMGDEPGAERRAVTRGEFERFVAPPR